MQINVFPSSQLGQQREMNEGLQLGTLDIVLTSSAVLAQFAPKVQVIDLDAAMGHGSNDDIVGLRIDPHSPARYRVLGPLADFPEFFEAFGCEGGAMLRPEELRPTIW